jgi:hypothetical protein
MQMFGLGILDTLLLFAFSTAAYPIARFILPRLESIRSAVILHISAGLFQALVLYQGDTLYCLFMTITCYYALIYLRPIYAIIVAYALVMGSHWIIMQRPTDWAIDMTGMTMVLLEKVWSLAFNLQDGLDLEQGKPLARKRWGVVAIREPPSFLIFLAYSFTPFGSFTGPFIEYRVFQELLLCGRKPESATPEADHRRAKFRFFGAFAWAAFVQVALLLLTYENTYIAPWYVGLPVLARSVCLPVITGCLACRYFTVWWLIEASFNEAGLVSTGIDLMNEDEISNLSMGKVLQSVTIDDWFRRWNHTTHLFWKNYLFTRLLDIKFPRSGTNFVVFIASMLWHGFRPVYLAMLPENFLMIQADQIWLRKCAPPEEWAPWAYWAKWLLVKWSMLYTTSTFFFPWMDQFWYVRKTVWFLPTVTWAIIGAVLLVLPRKKSERAAEKPKTE